MKKRYVASVLLLLALAYMIQINGLPTTSRIAIPPFFEFEWVQNEKAQEQSPPNEKLQVENPSIKISSFSVEQEVYQPNDTAKVYFEISNDLNVSYNVTVDWLHNNVRYYGWYNMSTNFYNTSQRVNFWHSYFTVEDKGDWEMQLIIKYEFRDTVLSKDEVVNFRVI